MIGIDITTISRFDCINLKRLGKKIGADLKSSKDAAKTWACLEAIYKASSKKFHFKDIQIVFEDNSSPKVIDKNNVLGSKYILSLSHELDLCIAVAVKDLSSEINKYK